MPRSLPGWIMDDPEFRKRKPSETMVLFVIASRCTHQMSDGSLVGCEGGQALRMATGWSDDTFRRRVKDFVGKGWLVVVRRRDQDAHLPHLFAIPGAPDSLPPLAQITPEPEVQDGQGRFWDLFREPSAGDSAADPSPQVAGTLPAVCGYPSPQVAGTPPRSLRVPSPQVAGTPGDSHIENVCADARRNPEKIDDLKIDQTRETPPPAPAPLPAVRIATVTKPRTDVYKPLNSQTTRTINNFQPEDLRDDDRVYQVFSDLVSRGRFWPSPSSLLEFFIGVERALERAGGKDGNPAAWLVKHLRSEFWGQGSRTQEDRANARIKSAGLHQRLELDFPAKAAAPAQEAHNSAPVPAPTPVPPPTAPSAPAAPQAQSCPQLSPEAQSVLSALKFAHANHSAAPARQAREICRRQITDFDAAAAELAAAGAWPEWAGSVQSAPRAPFLSGKHKPWTKADDDPRK